MKAAVFFPGIGYHCDKPLLYYSRKLAQECGYEETIALSYTYDGGNIRGNEEKMQQAFESLYEQAEKSLSAIDFDKYELGDEVDWQKCTYKNYQVSNSTFNTANAVKEGTKEYEYFQECMKDLAEQLTKLQDAGVPIILRPLHEAQGNEGNYGDGTAWFWWGDRGAEVYKELWKLLYNTLTEK